MNEEIDIPAVINAIKSCLPPGQKYPVGLHEPFFSGNEWTYIKECLDTTWVSSAGKYVDRFEEMLAGYTGVKRAVAVVNGTAALHICLKLAGVQPGDEVLIPTLTFVATANAVAYCGAVPHFADIEERTLGLDPLKLEDYLKQIAVLKTGQCINKNSGRVIKAVVAMHTFGHPVDLDPLAEVCRHFHLELIEDAAESLGTFYKGRHTGNWGILSALSFNGNKIVTTGGGGAILTNNQELGQKAKHITTTAKVPHRWKFYHDQVGYNYRLPNINAALGCAQMEQLPLFLEKKRALAGLYRQALAGIEGIKVFEEPAFARSNYWLNLILLNVRHTGQRDILLEATNNAGIATRPVWELMHRLPMFATCPRMDLGVSESVSARLINLPSSHFLYADSPKMEDC